MIEPSGTRTWRELDNKALEFRSDFQPRARSCEGRAPVKAQLYHSATSSITSTGVRQEDVSPEICSGLNWVDSTREHRDQTLLHTAAAQVKAERRDDSDSKSSDISSDKDEMIVT
ncbi:hypothetical protein V8E54_006447 [Elaphomyces granulatus]